MSSHCTSLRKNIRWYKKFLFEIILGTRVVTVWVICNNNSEGEKKDTLTCQEEIIERLLKVKVRTD